MYTVAKPLMFGKSTIWTYRTKDNAWYVYDADRVVTYTKAEAEAIAAKYPKAQVLDIAQAGKL